MGTVITLRINHPNPYDILNQLEAMLIDYEHRFSANDDRSELMMVNMSAGIKPIKVDHELFELIKIGKKQSIVADSNLNIAIGPLVQDWRIGFKDAKVPSNDELKALLQLTDPNQIELDTQRQTVYLKQKGMLIDLGSLAKGYFADKIINYLQIQRVESGLINLGGNIVTLGANPNNPEHYWQIGIRDPKGTRGESIAILKTFDESIVTSGIYERSLQKGNQTYHHILDVHTGYPISTDVISLTIVSKQSIDGEIWTTRLFGKSAAAILTTIDCLDGIEGVLVMKDERIQYSSGLDNRIILM